jgi:hypothetical protein
MVDPDFGCMWCDFGAFRGWKLFTIDPSKSGNLASDAETVFFCGSLRLQKHQQKPGRSEGACKYNGRRNSFPVLY